MRGGALACAAFFAASGARADVTPEQVAAARALGTEGVEAADAGDCAKAVDRLSRAEALFHAPTTLERLGECQIALGKIVAGVESLNRVVRETLPGTPPPAFVAAQARAKKALDEAQPKIGQLLLHLEKPADANAKVLVDGEPMATALLDVDRPIDPGTHKIEASAPGYKTAEGAVTIEPGKKAELTLKLVVDPNAPAPTAGPAAQEGHTAPAPAAEHHGGGDKTLAYVFFGVGGAGILVGSVLGIMALGTKSTLDKACDSGKSCPASSQSDIDALKTQSTVSTIGFVVGAVGAVAGVTLLLTSKPSQPHVSAWLGPNGGGLRGTFQ